MTTAVAPRARVAGPGQRVDLGVRRCRRRGGSPRRPCAPSASSSTQPTRGLGPSGHAGRARRARGRAASRALLGCAGRSSSAPRPVRSRTPGRRRGRTRAASGDGRRRHRHLRALPIRTFTVGPGVPPGQPATGCAAGSRTVTAGSELHRPQSTRAWSTRPVQFATAGTRAGRDPGHGRGVGSLAGRAASPAPGSARRRPNGQQRGDPGGRAPSGSASLALEPDEPLLRQVQPLAGLARRRPRGRRAGRRRGAAPPRRPARRPTRAASASRVSNGALAGQVGRRPGWPGRRPP